MRSENETSPGSIAAHDQVLNFIKQLHERLAALSTTSLSQEQQLQASQVELASTLEELTVAEEELHVQNEQMIQSSLTITHERQRYQDLFDTAPDAYLVTDQAGAIQDANHAAISLLGLDHRFLRGRPLIVFVPMEERTGFRQALRAAGQGAQPEEWELRLKPRQGPEMTVGVRVSLVDVSGQAASLRWILRDISLRRIAEAERFRVLIDAIPHIAWTTRADGCANYYNRRWYEYSGLTLEETRDRGWESTLHPDDRERVGGIWRAAFQAGTASEVEYRLKRADSAYCWHLGRWEPLRDGMGQVTGWVGTTTDITQRREAEQAQAALLEHDHLIATQLQEALQPGLPQVVAGLALTKHYEAALAEAGVGGDFFDTFTVENNCTALVVGDLSGKGLAAAAQVATVRNMLRALLYSKPRLVEAITTLNRILAENGLLDGFATLFVGIYEADTGALKYVNCGQEPALVRRAGTGKVEQLRPTGMILGAIRGAEYTEQVIRLSPGDSLVILTDGLTEVGPSRSEMLGIEGVASLLGQPIPSEEAEDMEQIAEHLALRLISGVDNYARGGVRDDVCLLVGVVR